MYFQWRTARRATPPWTTKRTTLSPWYFSLLKSVSRRRRHRVKFINSFLKVVSDHESGIVAELPRTLHNVEFEVQRGVVSTEKHQKYGENEHSDEMTPEIGGFVVAADCTFEKDIPGMIIDAVPFQDALVIYEPHVMRASLFLVSNDGCQAVEMVVSVVIPNPTRYPVGMMQTLSTLFLLFGSCD